MKEFPKRSGISIVLYLIKHIKEQPKARIYQSPNNQKKKLIVEMGAPAFEFRLQSHLAPGIGI